MYSNGTYVENSILRLLVVFIYQTNNNSDKTNSFYPGILFTKSP